MVDVRFTKEFRNSVRKLSKTPICILIKKQIRKIVENPSIGKPMRYQRKGTREVYIKPYRLAYYYVDDTIIFMDIYHKDEQCL